MLPHPTGAWCDNPGETGSRLPQPPCPACCGEGAPPNGSLVTTLWKRALASPSPHVLPVVGKGRHPCLSLKLPRGRTRGSPQSLTNLVTEFRERPGLRTDTHVPAAFHEESCTLSYYPKTEPWSWAAQGGTCQAGQQGAVWGRDHTV